MVGSSQAHVIRVVPTLATGAYTDGNVLFQGLELPAALFQQGRASQLISVAGLSFADISPGFDIVFTQSSVLLHAAGINAAPDVADATFQAAGYLGRFSVVAGDYTDLGGLREFSCSMSGRQLMFEGLASATSIFAAALCRGSGPTFGAVDALELEFGVKYW